MLTKIIDLGWEVPETGEPRVRAMTPGLVKTASTEIQEFWDRMPEDPKSSYLWVIGVSAMEFYGCNNNGDAFAEDELKATHDHFVNTAHVFLQHVNKDPAKSIGKPIYSWYNDAMHRVELILKINKSVANAASIVAKIKNGEPIFVSMGCTVDHDVCSICGNKAKTRREYCDHLRYNIKKILPDGRQVYAINPNPRFFDISIVAKPADPTAFTLDKRASLNGYANCDFMTKTSAELGEEYEDLSVKVAALKKMSDIIKRVDGQVVDSKIPVPDDFSELDYPEMPYDHLDDLGLSPSGLISCLGHLGSPITLGDAMWMSGQSVLGRSPSPLERSSMLGLLPKVINVLMDRPECMNDLLHDTCSLYNGELEEPVRRTIIIKVMRPVAEARISIVSSLGSPGFFEKLGAAFGYPDRPEPQYGRDTLEILRNDFNSRKENFAPIIIRDEYGNEAKTNPYYLRQAAFTSTPIDNPVTSKAILAAATLATLGAAATQPTLVRQILALCAAGAPTLLLAKVLLGKRNTETSEGGRIPTSLGENAYKFEKTSAAVPKPYSWSGFGTLVGMAAPGALALDYAYNKWRNDGYVEDTPWNRVGQFVTEHPGLSMLAGATVGTGAMRGIQGLFGK